MTYARLLSEALAATSLPSTGDVLSVGLPLLRQIDELHRGGFVTHVRGTDRVVYDGASLQLSTAASMTARRNDELMRRLDPPRTDAGIEITHRIDLDHGTGDTATATSLDVFDGDTDRPERPMFVVGYRAWEQWYDVHDELTDIHIAGQLLAAYALGLDLESPAEVHDLALRHRHLLALNPALHPVVAGVLTDMLAPTRHRRPSDLATVITSLEHHRELPPDLDLTGAYTDADDWQHAVLTILRERVFDLTRRNRSLYFRPTASTVSLTESSVPLLLDIKRVRPDDLLTWTGNGAAAFRSGKPVDLERWCRFEDSPHLAPALDTLMSNERKLRAEHGQGRLQLIAAFLRWVDPETGETVSSPLLVTPAELSRKKGVRDRYRVEVDETLDVNPVLRHVFRTRFGVTMPAQIDGDEASIRALVKHLESAVQATDPSVRIELVDTPRINLIRRRAELRVDAYRRRRARAAMSQGRWRRQDHSYDHGDWRPLGLALYRRFVRPDDLPLRSLTAAPPRPRAPQAIAPGLPPPVGSPIGSPVGSVPPAGARERTNYAAVTGDINRHRWEVDLCAVTLASLGTRRTNLVRDYNTVLALDGQNGSADGRGATFDSFEAIFSPTPRRTHRSPPAPFSVDQTLVLPADEAQAQAVQRAVQGESFIIQGPPGTGKSQTITNLLAAMVAEGKRVLFVCEKRAALDVVAHRLRQVGLGPLVATIHDSQLDRKDVIADLGRTYAAWLDPGDDDREAVRERALAAVHEVLDPLSRAFAELTDERGDRASLVSMIERLIALRTAGVEPAPNVPPELDAATWRAARPGLDHVVESAVGTGHTGQLGGVGALRIAPGAIGDDPVRSAREVGEQLTAATAALMAVFGSNSDAAEQATIDDVRDAHAVMGAVLDLDRAGATAVLDRSSGAHLDLRAANTALTNAVATAAAHAAVLERWVRPLDGTDARAALAVAAQKEGSVLRFLSGAWRRVRDLVRSGYRFDAHQVEPSITQVLTDLVAWHDADDTVARQRGAIAATYGTADPVALLADIDRLHANPVIAACAGGTADVAHVAAAVANVTDVADRIVVAGNHPIASLAHVAARLERTSVVDEPALVAWSHLAGASGSALLAALTPGVSLDGIERAVLDAALDRAGGGQTSIRGARLDEAVDRVLDRYRDLLDANAGMVAARARRRFLDHVAFSEASMAGRSNDDKAFKRSYSAGRRLLEREFQKKMRFRSIRELAAGDSGAVVRDLKPIWLMSPLSVSDTLPLDDGSFDAVVFDEASQIPVEDAVPTLFRAAQAIVVGDRMQLPPTRFFATEVDDDDVEIAVVDEDGHRMTVTLDADSFLTQADLALPSSTLTWHYRSRSEALIAYSNHAFYDARLATVPDRVFDPAGHGEIVVGGPEDGAANLGEVLSRPISFHRVPYGVYDQRGNEAEADYIAELVRAVLVSGTGLTIGIVAFSEAQQGVIESALAELATVDPAFADLLEAEQDRVDDGEYVGMFVKNLENVQGDERELIIMSVCYGPGPSGKMRMNFGPINQAGGERRLNVIFSRAKRHMAIVSTIDGSAITNTHNDGASHLARFLQYAAAESAGTARGESVLRSLSVGHDTDTADERSAVAEELAEHLRARGWRADVEVGRSAFTLDVAVRGENGYLLGVLIDPGDDDATATTRVVAEAGVLDAFGWPVTRVLVSEWWSSPAQVIDRVDHLLRSLPDMDRPGRPIPDQNHDR